jgi:glycosyltransferase involved in cell wall biosynthesis
MTKVEMDEMTRTTALRKPDGGLPRGLRVAVVQFWLSPHGGAERVLEALGEIFPQADFYALVSSERAIPAGLRGRRLRTSFVGRIPGAKRWHRHFLPLYPFALEQFDLSDYDLVISLESGPAKGVLTSPRTCHICYCLSPMRYLWDMYHQYAGSMNPVTRFVFSLTAHYARLWDFSTAARVDYFAAISGYVADRVRKYYRRQSRVIYPPVDVSAGHISPKIDDYYLVAGRLVTYKRVDLAIEACNRVGRRLRIVGTGPEYQRLRKLAGPTIEFHGPLDDESLRENYAHCRALLFAGEEDFGIVPVEAQSFGRPVIAYGRGGALETILGLDPEDGVEPEQSTGVFFQEQTPDSLTQAILTLEKAEQRFSPSFIRAQAQRFDVDRFKSEMATFVAEKFNEFHCARRVAGSAREAGIAAAAK